MGATEIDLLHAGVSLDLGHRALAQHLALVQHRDRVGPPAHEVHVVLDDDHGPVRADPLQQLTGRLALVGAHPGDRLVEQQHPGVLHQQHADLQPLLLTVGQHAGRLVPLAGEGDGLQGLLDDVGNATPDPEQRQRGASGSGGDVEVLQHTQFGEDAGGLEGAADAQPGDLVGLAADQLGGPVVRRPGGRDQAGQRVDDRRLPGPVGTDQEAQVGLEDGQVDTVHGLEAVEGDRQAADLEIVGLRCQICLLVDDPCFAGSGLRQAQGRWWDSGRDRWAAAVGPRPVDHRGQRGDATRQERDHQHEHRALEIGPEAGELLRQRGLGVRDDHGADHRAEQGVPAADGDADDEGDRGHHARRPGR